MALLSDFTMAKAIAVAIGFGIIILNIEIGLGYASYHIKPLLVGGIVTGGIIFGTGMAILGYCPGTLAVSIGEGSLDALIGLIGGLAGGVVYTVMVPSIKWILGPDLGPIALNTIITGSPTLFYLLVLISGGVLIGIAFWLNKIEKNKRFQMVLFRDCTGSINLRDLFNLNNKQGAWSFRLLSLFRRFDYRNN